MKVTILPKNEALAGCSTSVEYAPALTTAEPALSPSTQAETLTPSAAATQSVDRVGDRVDTSVVVPVATLVGGWHSIERAASLDGVASWLRGSRVGDGALGGCGRRYGCSAEQGSDGGLDAEGDGRFYVDIWAGLFRGCGLGVLGLGVGFQD